MKNFINIMCGSLAWTLSAVAMCAAENIAAVGISHAPAEVSVFADRASITRIGTTSLHAGKNEIAFNGIRDDIDLRSIRAGTNAQGVSVVGVIWERHVSTVVDNVKIAEIEEATAKLREKFQAEQDGVEALSKRETLLGVYFDQFSKEVAETASIKNVSQASTSKWKETIVKLDFELAATRERLATAKRSCEDLRQQISEKERELGFVYGNGNARRSISLVVTVVAEKNVEAAEISVSYVTHSAGWSPQYDVQLDENKKCVDMTYSGLVSQSTGEDWNGVRLTLSTAQPQVKADPPELKSIELFGKNTAGDMDRVTSEELEKNAVQDNASNMFGAEATAGTLGEFSSVGRQGASVSLMINSLQNISSAGQPHQVTIAKKTFSGAEVSYEAAPEFRNGVYIRAKFKNDMPYPILAGTVNIGRGFDFVGKSDFRYTPSGSYAEFFAGTLDGISSSDRRLSYKKPASKFFSESEEFIADIYEFSNITATPCKVRVRSQIPVSEIDDVAIEILKENMQHVPATTPGAVLDKATGMIYWDIEIPASGKKQIVLSIKKTTKK